MTIPNEEGSHPVCRFAWLDARGSRGSMIRSALAAASVASALAACVVSPTHQAPIVEHSQGGHAPPATVPPPAPPAPVAPPATREAHDGQYVVQAGDTLYSIALAFGQDFRDIARWNGLDDPTHLHVGQTLRIVPPATSDAEAAAAEAVPVPISPSGTLETRPLTPSAPTTAPPEPATPSPPQQAAQAPGGSGAFAGKAAAAEPEAVWAWPSTGKLLERFDETHNKGIEIAGSVGDPVWASNDGQVVYSGSGLQGYGKLVIIKHTDDYVSAYGHNNEILVTQGQVVKRGQHIADLGMTDAPTPRLRFEIRRRGTPVDPLTYLPSR
jgi:lipoprotein NlpD